MTKGSHMIRVSQALFLETAEGQLLSCGLITRAVNEVGEQAETAAAESASGSVPSHLGLISPLNRVVASSVK